jgi:hypothetical protein
LPVSATSTRSRLVSRFTASSLFTRLISSASRHSPRCDCFRFLRA